VRKIKLRSLKATTPVKCGFCGEKKAFHTGHGGGLYGKTTCRDCFNKAKEKQKEPEREQSEAEYQIERWLDIHG
jgi:hypothetical protein